MPATVAKSFNRMKTYTLDEMLRLLRRFASRNDCGFVTASEAKQSHFFRDTKKGFTLPEVVVAAALLLIAIVPILKALTQANLDSVIIERKTQSLCLAQGKLNRIKASSIYDFNDVTENNTDLGKSYLCNVSQTTVGSNLKAISVSVGQDINGNGMLASDEIEVTLQTQIVRRWP